MFNGNLQSFNLLKISYCNIHTYTLKKIHINFFLSLYLIKRALIV